MCNGITANICELANKGFDLQLSLSLNRGLMAIIAAVFGPVSSIRLSSGFKSKPVPEVAPKSFYVTWISHSIAQHSLRGQNWSLNTWTLTLCPQEEQPTTAREVL